MNTKRKSEGNGHQGVDPKALWHRFLWPGPVSKDWVTSTKHVALVCGPYGTMKTTAGAMKCLLTAARQHPSKFDGVRKAHIVAIRQNYRRMHKTLIPSIKKFFGNDAEWLSFEKNGPCTLKFDWSDKNLETGSVSNMSLVLEFAAFGDQEITEFVAGYEPTSFWLNEWNELPKNSIGSLLARCTDRAYASELSEEHNRVPADYSRLFGDCNAPDLDEWATDFTINPDYLSGRDPMIQVWMQPSGFSKDAEGMYALQPGYAEKMRDGFLKDGTPWKIKRFIENISGYSVEGAPIFTEFDQARHISQRPIIPEKNRQLIIGIDQGGQSASVITQKRSSGQVTILAEVCPSPEEFIGGAESARRLAEHMAEHEHLAQFLSPGRIVFKVDSAASQRNAAVRDGEFLTFLREFMRGWELATGYSISGSLTPWKTSHLQPRIDSVRKLLLGRTRKTNEEMLSVDPSCLVINRGFAGGYRRTENRLRPGTYSDKPEKNYYANAIDALQAACMEHVSLIAQGITAGQSRDDDFAWRNMGFETGERHFCEPMEVVH